MQKALDAHAEPYLAFLDFRNTPTEGYTTSPAQRMLNRRTRTQLPMSNRLLKPEIPTGVYKSQKANQAEQAFYYNKTAKDLKPLSDGDVVRLKLRNKLISGPTESRQRLGECFDGTEKISSFWFVFSGGSSLSVPRLVIFHWDPKSNGETKRVYLLVINESVKVVVRYIIYASK